MKTAEEIISTKQKSSFGRYSYERVIEAMEEYTEQFNPKWIDVKERYPDKMVNVLCINEQGYMKVGAFWVEEKYFSGNDSFNNITHWQPLPQPPDGL